MSPELPKSLITGILTQTIAQKKFLFSCYFKNFRHLAHPTLWEKMKAQRFLVGAAAGAKRVSTLVIP